MKRFLTILTFCGFIASMGMAWADTTVVGGGGGVSTASNCDQAAYYPIGKLCQDTDDGKLYKGTGAAVEEVGAGSCTPTEIDGHAAASPTASQLSSCNATTIHNASQAAADVNITLPTTAANLGFLATVSTAQAANYWRFTSAAGGDIYLNGSATGKNYVQYATPTVGYYFSCFTVNVGGTYKWYCADGVGTLATN